MIEISRLLKLSSDLIIITDRKGNLLKIGEQFQKILEKLNISQDILKDAIVHAFPKLESRDYLVLLLNNYNFHASHFSILFQDTQVYILLAENQTAHHQLNLVKKRAKKTEYQHIEKNRQVHTLLDGSSDPIFSFKKDGTYIYVNHIFARTLGYNPEEIMGKKIWDIFPQAEADKRFATGETDNIEVKIPLPDGDKYFLTTVKPIKDDQAQVSFVICISKDITELRETQNHLKTLKGILPICAHCKNIRDDEGYWNKLEAYIDQHSEATFSHGICPDCVEELYPDYAEPSPLKNG